MVLMETSWLVNLLAKKGGRTSTTSVAARFFGILLVILYEPEICMLLSIKCTPCMDLTNLLPISSTRLKKTRGIESLMCL
jgi:hypothetical protein